jgi:5-methylcytosine-specific restriction endonuclease McrA
MALRTDNALREQFNRRYTRLLAREKSRNLPPPDKEQLYEKLQMAYLNGFGCCYCGRKMEVQQPYPNLDVFSFDHYNPLADGGDNNIDNIVFCCHSCNMTKGTINGDTYKELLESIPDKLKNQVISQSYKSRLAGSIERDQWYRKP